MMFALAELCLRFWVWTHTLGTLYVGLKNAETQREARRATQRRQSALSDGITSTLVWIAYRFVESYLQAWLGWLPLWSLIRLAMLSRFVWERKSYNAACTSLASPVLTPLVAAIEPYMDNVLHIATVTVAYAHFLLTLLLAKARPYIVSAFRSGLLDLLFQSAEDSYTHPPPPPPPPPSAFNPAAVVNTALDIGRAYLPGWVGGLGGQATSPPASQSPRAQPHARTSASRGESSGSSRMQGSPQAYRLSPQAITPSRVLPRSRTSTNNSRGSPLRPASIVAAIPNASRALPLPSHRSSSSNFGDEAAMQKLSALPSPPKEAPFVGGKAGPSRGELASPLAVPKDQDRDLKGGVPVTIAEEHSGSFAPSASASSPLDAAGSMTMSANVANGNALAPSTVSPVVPGAFGRAAPLYPSLASLGVPMLGAGNNASIETTSATSAPRDGVDKVFPAGRAQNLQASNAQREETNATPYIPRASSGSYTTPSQRIAARSAALAEEQERARHQAPLSNIQASSSVEFASEAKEALSAKANEPPAKSDVTAERVTATQSQPRKKVTSSTSSRIARPKKASKVEQASAAATTASRRNLRTRSQSYDVSDVDATPSSSSSSTPVLEATGEVLSGSNDSVRLGQATPRRKLGKKHVFIPDEDGNEDSAWEAALRLRKASNSNQYGAAGPFGNGASAASYSTLEVTPKASKSATPQPTASASSVSPARPSRSAAALLAPSKTAQRASDSTSVSRGAVQIMDKAGKAGASKLTRRGAKPASVAIADGSAAVPTRRSTRVRAAPREKGRLGTESDAATQSEDGSALHSDSREASESIEPSVETSDEEYAERVATSRTGLEGTRETSPEFVTKMAPRRRKRKAEENEGGVLEVDGAVETDSSGRTSTKSARSRSVSSKRLKNTAPKQTATGSNGAASKTARQQVPEGSLPRGASKRSLALAKARQGPLGAGTRSSGSLSEASEKKDGKSEKKLLSMTTSSASSKEVLDAAENNVFNFGGKEEAERAERELGRLLTRERNSTGAAQRY